MNDNPLKPRVIASAINPTGETPSNDAERGKARVALMEEIAWLKRLTANEDFRRYVDALKSECNLSRSKIDSIESLTAEQSARYGQKLVAQLGFAEWADNNLKHLIAVAKDLDEKQRKLPS